MDPEEDEGKLIAAAQAGDGAAFARLVERHADQVYRIVAGHLGPTEAEDAAQEAFIRVHQGLRSFQGDARLSTWIYRIATNVALTRGRRRRARPRPSPLEAAPEPVAPGPAPGERAASDERREAVRRAVAELPEKERAVAVLRAFEGLSFEEIAETLGIERPTAESRMFRAKERLRHKLKYWLDM